MRINLIHLILVAASIIATDVIGQDRAYVSSIIDSLCAPRYHGRGYVNDGDTKAARFIVRELKRLNEEAKTELLPFNLEVNTFPGDMKVSINDHVLIPGSDYIIDPKSGGISGEFEAVHFKSKWAKSKEYLFNQISKGRFENKVVVLDTRTKNAEYAQIIADVYSNPLKAEAYILLTDKKLTWSVSRAQLDFPVFHITASSTPKKIKRVNLNVDQKFEADYTALNVMTTIKGTGDTAKKSIVYTAHLDHLGRMGTETYIAGASDNASGSAMLLDLYQHYIANPTEQDVVFIWFGGEEAGLVGSRHFVEDAPIALDRIQFLLNLDLMGDAGKGITAVNGKVFDQHFAKLSSLNMELGLLEKVKARGPAANSDHHPFYEKGVPCFFIYTMGDYTHYHDIYDVPENLPLAKYDEVFQLVTAFMENGI
ncbi:MAG: hypothetical protein Salg2KO_06430 [Salibacteraceae bacterium]